MFTDRFSKGPIVEGFPKSSEVLSTNSMRKGGIARFVRAACVGVLLAASLPSPAFSASPKKQADCHLATDLEKECALRDPMAVLDLIPQYKQKRWIKDYLVSAYKNNVSALLSRASKFKGESYYNEIVFGAFQWASQNDPAVIFIVPELLDEVCAEKPKQKQKIILDAARLLVKVSPMMAVKHCDDFKDIPGGGKLLTEAATKVPWFVFEEYENVQNCHHASALFLGASRGDPILALQKSDLTFHYDWPMDVYFPAMKKHPKIALATLSNLKYWVFYGQYFVELNKKFPGLALKDPNLILENGWIKDDWIKEEFFREMKKDPELALENLSKLKDFLWYRDYFRELSAILLKKDPRYLLAHSHQIPEGIHKTMLVDSLKARFGE